MPLLITRRPVVLGILAVISTATAAESQISWTACEPAIERARCGVLPVRENRALPDGRWLDLRFAVVRASGPQLRREPVLVLLGGPGDAASRRLPALAAQQASLNVEHDLVFVDQRGTGASSPLLCPPLPANDLQAYMEFLPVTSFDACIAALHKKADLARYGTADFVADLEELRAALGIDRWNLHGVSYGTRVALHYMSVEPLRIRAAVLVGVVPPELVMPVPFGADADHALRLLATDCNADSLCAAAFPRFAEEVDSVARRLARAPASVVVKHPVTGTASTVRFTRAAFGETVRAALYAPLAARRLPLEIHAAFLGDPAALAQAHVARQRALETWTGMYLAVTCAEDIARADERDALSQNASTVLGDGRVRRHFEACRHWPRRAAGIGWPPGRIETPTLMLVGDADPVTPPRWAELAMKRMSRVRAVVVPHGGHGFAGLVGAECLDRLPAEFLLSAAPAALDVSCARQVRRPPFAVPAQLTQPALDDGVDSIVSRETLQRGVPGLAVVIAARGNLVLQRAYGIRDADTRSPVTLATPFNVASLTKPFTSIVALRLARAGRLRIDAPAAEYVSWLPRQYGGLTIRQLLTHTSGIARDLRRDNFDDPSQDEYRARLGASAASAAPGARWEYSNTGYTVLGWALEAAGGRPFDELLRSLVFDSLGMRQAKYRAPLDGDAERARPHTLDSGRARRATYVSGGFASGGLILSGADLAAFALGLQRGRVLGDQDAATAWTGGRLSNGKAIETRMFGESATYGFGWFLATFHGHRLLTHGGAIEGFASNLYHFPDRRLTIAVVANSKSRTDGTAAVDSVAQSLARYCLAHAACSPAMSAEERAARAAIAQANLAFSRAYVAGDTAALRAAYTSDAVAMPPSGRLFRGEREIARLFAAPTNRRRVAHALHAERLDVHGETAVESGSWYDASERAGVVNASSGRYVVSWLRENGAWKMTSDAWWAAPPPR